MSKRLPLLMALGAGLSLWMVFQQRRRQENTRRWEQRSPGTALITGASSGIGAAFAWALARQGYDLVLLARREDRLRALADEIQRSHPVQVEILPTDLSDPAAVEQAAARIAEIDNLDLLVNNAGFGTGGDFAWTDIQPELRMIQVHINATVRLTRATLPGMIQRGRGGIIQVSSLAALMPMPGSLTYGATKAYLNFFSKGLNEELRGSGVRVQALCPGLTYSEFHDAMNVDRSALPAFVWMRAENVVEESLCGLREGQNMVIPGTLNRLFALVLTNPLMVPLVSFAQTLGVIRRIKGLD